MANEESTVGTYEFTKHTMYMINGIIIALKDIVFNVVVVRRE